MPVLDTNSTPITPTQRDVLLSWPRLFEQLHRVG
jgi:hypothetical protein